MPSCHEKRRLILGQSARSLSSAAAPAVVPQRWLPVSVPPPAPSPSPRRGWQRIDSWSEAAGSSPAKGCSALVRAIRRAEQEGEKTPASFWRRVASRGGSLAAYLSPAETCEILNTLADARLRWERDAISTRGLKQFADWAADEIGAYTPTQMSSFLSALARISYQHEGFMQALSRAVEHTVKAERGRLNNESLCVLLDAYRRLGVLDEPVMRSLSRLLCRRLVREPLTPEQTASVVVAYAGLRVRDLALFNATTLALCRTNAVEALNWTELATVAASYASLRLHSASLFARIRQRLFDSAGLVEEEDVGTELSSVVSSPSLASLREQLAEPPPAAPPLQLPMRAVAAFLEAQVHLDRLAVHDLMPLLPHLAHDASGTAGSTGVARSSPAESGAGELLLDRMAVAPKGRAAVEMATLLAVAISRGGHIWPWLWRRTLPAFGNGGLPPRTLLSLLNAVGAHLLTLQPLLMKRTVPLREARGTQRKAAISKSLIQHLRSLSWCLMQLWRQLGQRCQLLTDVDLQHLTIELRRLIAAQAAVEQMLDDTGKRGSDATLNQPLRQAAIRCVRRVVTEVVRRRVVISQEDLAQLFDICDITPEEVRHDVQRLALDALDAV